MHMGKKSVAFVIVVYHKPSRLERLWENMLWAGVPDIHIYVFEDPCPHNLEERASTSYTYHQVCNRIGLKYETAPEWGCIQGITEFATQRTTEDWLIWIPDDVMFSKGALWNEYAAVLTYGRDYIGAMQMPYWNAHDLVTMGVMPSRDIMFTGWQPGSGIPRNPHWDHFGLPRAYINCNGAGFAFSRDLWRDVGGFP